jgi:hypothetical protein
MNGRTTTGMVDEVPPGVTAGESVPMENSLDAREQAKVDRLAAEMKGRAAYADLSDQERRQRARDRLERLGVLS